MWAFQGPRGPLVNYNHNRLRHVRLARMCTWMPYAIITRSHLLCCSCKHRTHDHACSWYLQLHHQHGLLSRSKFPGVGFRKPSPRSGRDRRLREGVHDHGRLDGKDAPTQLLCHPSYIRWSEPHLLPDQRRVRVYTETTFFNLFYIMYTKYSIIIHSVDIKLLFITNMTLWFKQKGNRMIVFKDSCRWVPYLTFDLDQNSIRVYLHFVIEFFSCEVDPNTHTISQTTHETRFVFQDFEYTSDHSGIDVRCTASFCGVKDHSSKCTQTCHHVARRAWGAEGDGSAVDANDEKEDI